MDDTLFIGITSAAGGSGISSLSVLLARTIKRMMIDQKCEVLVLSFDAISSKMAPENISKKPVKRLLTRIIGGKYSNSIDETYIDKDDFGVSFIADSTFYNPLNTLNIEELMVLLTKLSESKLFNYVILDIPFTSLNSMQQASCCEKLIICNGYLDSQIRINQRLFTSIKKYIESLDQKPELISFEPIYDSDSFSENGVDLHGQYAAKVRELASQFLTSNKTE